MGGIVSSNGITIQFYDESGNPDATHPPRTFPCCWLTAQLQGTVGVGSGDWLKEVYLAPDPTSLYQLMRRYPPTGTSPPLTSGASQQVSICYVDQKHQLKKQPWQSVIALGTDVTITGPDGEPEKLRVFDTLEVTNGDANDPDNKLYNDFQKAVKALMLS